MNINDCFYHKRRYPDTISLLVEEHHLSGHVKKLNRNLIKSLDSTTSLQSNIVEHIKYHAEILPKSKLQDTFLSNTISSTK